MHVFRYVISLKSFDNLLAMTSIPVQLDISAIVKSCDDSIKLGLTWTTKRCLGYKSLAGRDVGIVVVLPSVTRGATISARERLISEASLRGPR